MFIEQNASVGSITTHEIARRIRVPREYVRLAYDFSRRQRKKLEIE